VVVLVESLIVWHIVDFSMEYTTWRDGLAWEMMDWGQVRDVPRDGWTHFDGLSTG